MNKENKNLNYLYFKLQNTQDQIERLEKVLIKKEIFFKTSKNGLYSVCWRTDLRFNFPKYVLDGFILNKKVELENYLYANGLDFGDNTLYFFENNQELRKFTDKILFGAKYLYNKKLNIYEKLVELKSLFTDSVQIAWKSNGTEEYTWEWNLVPSTESTSKFLGNVNDYIKTVEDELSLVLWDYEKWLPRSKNVRNPDLLEGIELKNFESPVIDNNDFVSDLKFPEIKKEWKIDKGEKKNNNKFESKTKKEKQEIQNQIKKDFFNKLIEKNNWHFLKTSIDVWKKMLNNYEIELSQSKELVKDMFQCQNELVKFTTSNEFSLLEKRELNLLIMEIAILINRVFKFQKKDINMSLKNSLKKGEFLQYLVDEYEKQFHEPINKEEIIHVIKEKYYYDNNLSFDEKSTVESWYLKIKAFEVDSDSFDSYENALRENLFKILEKEEKINKCLHFYKENDIGNFYKIFVTFSDEERDEIDNLIDKQKES